MGVRCSQCIVQLPKETMENQQLFEYNITYNALTNFHKTYIINLVNNDPEYACFRALVKKIFGKKIRFM